MKDIKKISLQNLKNGAGFTLMELMVAITIGVLVIAGLGSIFSGTAKIWNKIQYKTTALREGKLAMEWLTLDIREGTLLSMGNDYIRLSTAEYPQPVNFILRRVSGPDSDIVMTGLTSLRFSYYNKDGLIETDISKVNFILILFTIQKGGQSMDFRTGVNLRNIAS